MSKCRIGKINKFSTNPSRFGYCAKDEKIGTLRRDFYGKFQVVCKNKNNIKKWLKTILPDQIIENEFTVVIKSKINIDIFPELDLPIEDYYIKTPAKEKELIQSYFFSDEFKLINKHFGLHYLYNGNYTLCGIELLEEDGHLIIQMRMSYSNDNFKFCSEGIENLILELFDTYLEERYYFKLPIKIQYIFINNETHEKLKNNDILNMQDILKSYTIYILSDYDVLDENVKVFDGNLYYTLYLYDNIKFV